jgi:hypothetical protein
LVLLLGTLTACANVNARYDGGQRAFSTGAWQQAIDELERFMPDADRASDSRCAQVRVDIAECQLRLGQATKSSQEMTLTPGTSIAVEVRVLDKDSAGPIAEDLYVQFVLPTAAAASG